MSEELIELVLLEMREKMAKAVTRTRQEFSSIRTGRPSPALVEKNQAYNNTAGILVFLLPNNPSKVSINCKVINNEIYDNNHENFGDEGAIVSLVPVRLVLVRLVTMVISLFCSVLFL